MLFERSISVPGKVIESNGHQVEKYTSRWRMDEENRGEVKGELDPRIVFEGKGLKIVPVE